jgi:cytochrome c-L
MANPPGSLWRVVPADKVPAGAETARTLVSLGDKGSSGQEIKFLHSLDNKPLKLPVDDVSQSATEFYQTGINPYKDNPKAIATGSDLYQQWCQSCHLKDGSGRIGPSIVDDKYNYSRGDTDVGLFEIIFGGGTGAMQAFGNRMSPDEMLQLMAFIQTLK